jgi:uncharacterized protein (DUF302 family)
MRRLIAAALALGLPLSAAIGEELATKPSKFPVKETVDRLTAALKDKGITPVARIDHSAAAKAAGLELAPTEVLLFGNPKLGTQLMQASPQAAIDLPMRVLVWQDAGGKVWIGYAPPSVLKSRHNIQGKDEVLKALTGALEAFTSAAAQ